HVRVWLAAAFDRGDMYRRGFLSRQFETADPDSSCGCVRVDLWSDRLSGDELCRHPALADWAEADYVASLRAGICRARLPGGIANRLAGATFCPGAKQE